MAFMCFWLFGVLNFSVLIVETLHFRLFLDLYHNLLHNSLDFGYLFGDYLTRVLIVLIMLLPHLANFRFLKALNLTNLGIIMLMSHMEPKDQRWPNVRLGEIGDISAAFNNGFSDILMNNLWVYDFNILEESQSRHLSVFPVQESYAYTVSDPASRFLVDTHQNREDDDPNSIKITEMVECKVTQKSVKGPRSKRCKRAVFEGPWNFTSTASIDLYGSVDNQGSAMSKRTSGEHDVGERAFKKQKSENLENSDLISDSISVNSVGRWLEDVGFGRYAGVFEMHEVDEEALPLLTLDDLKEMGVLAFGPRRKLYAAICQLKGK